MWGPYYGYVQLEILKAKSTLHKNFPKSKITNHKSWSSTSSQSY